jgi:hypothetical protein
MKKKLWLFAVGCMVASLLVLFLVRILTAKSNAVHYHADFALYINGVRDEFKGPAYYEEVQACSTNNHDNPRARVHMHDNENSIVHVHDHGVTWGAFFANLGYTLSDKVVATTDGIYLDGIDGNKLSFMLNGKSVDTVANRLIGDEDVLLVDYGKDTSETIQNHYDAIPRKAHEENLEKDPASCGGASPTMSMSDKMKHALKFWE